MERWLSNCNVVTTELAIPVNLTSQPHIKPVCLPQQAGSQYGGQPAVVSGWGTVGSGASLNSALHQVTVNVFNDSGKGHFIRLLLPLLYIEF